jgi:undecaprenyl-diphosphatase
MDLLQVTILSAIEGLTEFLPISSTGHLILASKLLNISTTEFTKTFEVAIQLGAIMAIVILYFKRFLGDLELYKKLFVAFIPTAIVGFLLYPLIKGYLLGSSSITLVSLFLGGLVLIFFKGENIKGKEIGYKEAFMIGAFQAISVVPGVSRAAATIIGGLLVGVNRKTAVEFSFLLAVPTMLAATGYDIYKSAGILNSSNIQTLLLGGVLSFIFALLAVKFLIRYVQKHNFTIFGIYRIALATIYYLLV